MRSNNLKTILQFFSFIFLSCLWVSSVQASLETPTHADIDGNGTADLLWRNTSNGATMVWLMNASGTIQRATFPGGAPAEWVIVDVEDVNGDRRADLIWSNSLTGQVVVWFLNADGTVRSPGFPGGAPKPWKLTEVADVNGDGRADLIWSNSLTGQVVVWFLNADGSVNAPGFPGGAAAPWTLANVADVNGDGRADLVWQDSSTGQVVVWFLQADGTVSSAGFPGGAAAPWALANVADVNGDGRADLIWRNTNSGTTVVWLMNASGAIQRVTFPGRAPTEWVSSPGKSKGGDSHPDDNRQFTWGNCEEDSPGLCTKFLSLKNNILEITLVNASPVDNGGFITADGFDLGPDVQITAFTQLTGPPNFSLTEGPVDTAPFGTREFIISLSNQWQEGGTASDGIGVQESATFQLTLRGKGVESLQAAKILESQVIRFREFTDGDDDKDPIIPFEETEIQGLCEKDSPGLCTKFLTLKDNILEITLVNSSPVGNGGFITADAFNLGPDVHVSQFSQLSGPMNFELVNGPIKTSPFSDREFVITISPNASQPWLGGGSPRSGIPPGQRATFKLILKGEGVESLTVRNILKSQLIRFKGFTNGSSDKDWIAAGLHGRCDEDLPGLCVKQLALSGNTLLLKLVNTSPVGNRGFITADGFDLGPDVQITAFTQLTGPPNFSLTEGPVDTAPFGTRDFIISLSNQWQGGGTASDGIGVQESATFQLTLRGKGVESLQAAKILESQVIRFREFTNGDKDKDRVALQ